MDQTILTILSETWLSLSSPSTFLFDAIVIENYSQYNLHINPPPNFLQINTPVLQTQQSIDCCHSTPKTFFLFFKGETPNPPVSLDIHTLLIFRLKKAQIVVFQHLKLSIFFNGETLQSSCFLQIYTPVFQAQNSIDCCHLTSKGWADFCFFFKI